MEREWRGRMEREGREGQDEEGGEGREGQDEEGGAGWRGRGGEGGAGWRGREVGWLGLSKSIEGKERGHNTGQQEKRSSGNY